MRSFLNVLVTGMVLALPLCGTAVAQTPTHKLGRTPSTEEIRAWDISIDPEGKGLPPGRGTAQEGAAIYARRCAVCHGPTGAEVEAPDTKARGVLPLNGRSFCC